MPIRSLREHSEKDLEIKETFMITITETIERLFREFNKNTFFALLLA